MKQRVYNLKTLKTQCHFQTTYDKLVLKFMLLTLFQNVNSSKVNCFDCPL